MASMNPAIKLALIIAIPVEIVNLPFAFWFDPGFPDNAGRVLFLTVCESEFLHWPGLLLIDWFDRMHLNALGDAVLGVIGYLDTALLFFAIILCFQWLRRFAGKLSTSRN